MMSRRVRSGGVRRPISTPQSSADVVEAAGSNRSSQSASTTAEADRHSPSPSVVSVDRPVGEAESRPGVEGVGTEATEHRLGRGLPGQGMTRRAPPVQPPQPTRPTPPRVQSFRWRRGSEAPARASISLDHRVDRGRPVDCLPRERDSAPRDRANPVRHLHLFACTAKAVSNVAHAFRHRDRPGVVTGLDEYNVPRAPPCPRSVDHAHHRGTGNPSAECDGSGAGRVPAIGLTSSDQRRPGSKISLPIMKSPTVAPSMCLCISIRPCLSAAPLEMFSNFQWSCFLHGVRPAPLRPPPRGCRRPRP